LCGKVFAQESLEGGLVVVFAAGGWKVDARLGRRRAERGLADDLGRGSRRLSWGRRR